jgi:hypothetical protein
VELWYDGDGEMYFKGGWLIRLQRIHNFLCLF